MKQENIEKPKKNTYHKEKKSQKQKPRYQKMVTTVLYLALFIIVGYTFWEFWHVGESVSPEIYDKTVDLFLGLLGITGSLKISETIMDLSSINTAIQTILRLIPMSHHLVLMTAVASNKI